MANTKSAVKRARQSEERRQRNVHIKSTVRGAVRDVRQSAASNPAAAAEQLRRASSVLDKAVTKGTIHRNTAARRKSRLSKLVNAKVTDTSGGQEG